jgi:hypothetical protein
MFDIPVATAAQLPMLLGPAVVAAVPQAVAWGMAETVLPLEEVLNRAAAAAAVSVVTARHPPQHREALVVPVEINILEHLAEPLALLVVVRVAMGLPVRVVVEVAVERLPEPLALVAQVVRVTKLL